MDLLNPSLGQKPWINKEKGLFAFTKTADFLLEFSVLRAGVLKRGSFFLLIVGAFLVAVKLLCLHCLTVP